MRRGSQIDSAVFRQVLPNADLLDAVEESKEARIAGRIVKAASEKAEARRLAKVLVRDYIHSIKTNSDATWEDRKKAEALWELVEAKVLDESLVIDPLYDQPAVANFWMSEAEDESDKEWEEDQKREMIDDAVNEILTRMRIIGRRAKEVL